jgi:multiple sugar transport system substrate-binding protein
MFRRDLDPVPASVFNAADFTKTFYPVAASDLTNGTSLAGIPLEYDGLALYINEDIFATAGKNPPTTWDDLRMTACQLTTITNGTITQAGVALGTTGNVDHWPEILGLMMMQNGVDLTKPTGKPAEDALSFYTVFSSDKACAGSGASSAKVWDSTLPASTVAFAAGKLAMYFGPSWRAFEIKEQNPSLKFRTAPLPQLPKSSPSDRNLTYASYWAEGVWAKSKNKAAAWDFLKFLSSKESLEKFYTNASKLRMFGEPYPRVDMASLVRSDPYVGSIIAGASDADSWYLQSRTFDGPTGINSQINKYFEDAVNAVNSGNTTPQKALETVSAGVTQILSQYGLVGQQE